MRQDQWDKILYFRASEFNNSEQMQMNIIQRLDMYREFIDTPIKITSDYRDSSTSQHGKGLAVDIMFPAKRLHNLFDLYLAAERFNFTGIGIYVDWKLDEQVIGGFHLDSRMLKSDKKGARWICYKDENGKQIYVALTLANLEKYGVL